MKRLYRDRWDKKIGGVCGGLGQYLKIDPTIIRIVYVLLTILTGLLPMIIIYLIAWLLMPLGPKLKVEPNYPRLYRSRTNRKIAGICGGIAKLTKIDPTVIRISLIVALFITGIFPVLIAYFVGTALIPEEPRNLEP